MKLVLGIILAVMTPFCVLAQSTISEPTEGTRDAASQGLSTLRSLISPSDLPLMGVRSIDEFGRSQLGAPIPIYFFSLRAIRNFEPGTDPNAVLKTRNKFLYPVKLGNLVVSSIVVQQTKKGWGATDLGDLGLVKSATKAITDSATSNQIQASLYFLVEIPGLSLYFVGHRSGTGIILQSISDVPDIDLKAAVEEPAEKIFEALKPLAQGSYDSPG